MNQITNASIFLTVIPAEYHSHDGNLKVTEYPTGGLGDYFLGAAQELGYPILDLNGRFTEGVLF